MAKALTDRPDVFGFHDYREFLRQVFAHAKASPYGPIRNRVARDLGISQSALSLILSGKRRLTQENAVLLGSAIGLHPSEQKYFEILVLKGDSRSHDAVIDSMHRMGSLRSFRKNNPREAEVFRYLTHWYYVVIREMTALPDFKLDAKWIKQHILYKVPVGEVQKAIDFLVQHRYIEVQPDGKVKPPDRPLDCMDGTYKTALGQFHRELLQLAGRSIATTPSENRSIIGFTFVGDQEKFRRVSEIITRAQAEIRAVAQEPCDNETVFHAELCLFPLTQDSRGRKS